MNIYKRVCKFGRLSAHVHLRSWDDGGLDINVRSARTRPQATIIITGVALLL